METSRLSSPAHTPSPCFFKPDLNVLEGARSDLRVHPGLISPHEALNGFIRGHIRTDLREPSQTPKSFRIEGIPIEVMGIMIRQNLENIGEMIISWFHKNRQNVLLSRF
jgi:hypothetical protein